MAPDTTWSRTRDSASGAEHREEAGLRGGVRPHAADAAERPSRREHLGLRLDDVDAGEDEVLGEPGVLAGGHGDVPAVNEDVDEAVPAVHLARHRAVRDRARPLHRARLAED